MTHVLGGYELPYIPPLSHFSGIRKIKSRADIKTYEGNVTLNWGFNIKDYPVIYYYPYMDEEFYQALKTLYEKNQEYEYDIEDGNIYIVEILNLEAEVYKPGQYRKNIKMKLAIKNIL